MADSGKPTVSDVPSWSATQATQPQQTKPLATGAAPDAFSSGMVNTKPLATGPAPAAPFSQTTPAASPPAGGGTGAVYQYQYADGTTGTSPWLKNADGSFAFNKDGSLQEGRYLGSNLADGQAAMAMMGYGNNAAVQPIYTPGVSTAGGASWGGGTGGALPAGTTNRPPVTGGGMGTAIPMPKPGVVGGGTAGGTPSGTGTTGSSYGGGGFGAAGVPGAVDDASRQRVEQALLSRLEPQYRQDEAQMRNQLLSSGLEVGTPAYNSELDRLSRAQNDARMQAVLAGGSEESRQVGLNAQLQGQAFNQGLQGAQFDNATRQQMLAELLLQRNTPLNELNALRTGNQVSMPSFGNYYTGNAQAAPIFDAATAQGNYNAQAAAASQSGTNALIGAGATAAAAFF